MSALDARLACVLGEIDLVQALAMGRIGSAVVAKPGTPVCYSRWTRDLIGWIDPWIAPHDLLDLLLAWAATRPASPVLYYDGDWELLFVSRHREELSRAFRFVVADAELVENSMDKERFQALAQRLDLPVPRAIRLDATTGWSTSARELTFPLVVKPLTRQHATWQSVAVAKAIRASTQRELDEISNELKRANVTAIAQEEVRGPETRVESYHVYVDDAGSVVADYTGRKIRTHPSRFGYSCALEITDSPDVAALGREIIERLGLRGVAKLDFKRAAGGSLKLLEVNPRFNLWHHLGARAGVNIPQLVYCDLTGEQRPVRRQARPGVRWVSPYRDLMAAREEGIGFVPWLAWALRCEAVHGFSWNDPLPLPHSAFSNSRRHFRQKLEAANAVPRR